MAIIDSRQKLIDYCLRRLGFPVIEINVDVDQIEDRIDDAFQLYVDYHFDGTEKKYLVHQVTQEDLDNQYIPIPDRMLFVTRLLAKSGLMNQGSIMGDANLALQNNPIGQSLLGITSSSSGNAKSSPADHAGGSGSGFSMAGAYLALKNIDTIQNIFGNGLETLPVEFNRKTNHLHIFADWASLFNIGDHIVIEGWESIDPDTNTEVYNDMWIKKYATALIKRQWGENLSKYQGIQLIGGVALNGEKIYGDAVEELNQLEEELQEKYEMPPLPLVG